MWDNTLVGKACCGSVVPCQNGSLCSILNHKRNNVKHNNTHNTNMRTHDADHSHTHGIHTTAHTDMTACWLQSGRANEVEEANEVDQHAEPTRRRNQ